MEPNVGPDDHYGSFPLRVNLGFYDSGYKHGDIGITVLSQSIGVHWQQSHSVVLEVWRAVMSQLLSCDSGQYNIDV